MFNAPKIGSSNFVTGKVDPLDSEIKPSGSPNSPKSRLLLYILGIIVSILVLVLIGWTVYTQLKLRSVQQQLQQQQNNPQVEAEKQIKNLLDKVGQLIVLPKDEQPTIATVSDLSKLQGKAFFKNAQLGDKVMIYSKAKKAILYRPSDNKIIELAPLINDQPAS